jgi:hypothetical protein
VDDAADAAIDAGVGEAANAPELPADAAIDAGELPRSHYLSYNDDGMLRGSRVHLVPPIHIPIEHLLYSRGFIEVYLAALEAMGLTAAGTTTRTGTATRAGTREKPMLDYATIMHTSYPSCDQTFHQDAPFPEGMRVQLPLMDVPLDLGPIQIKPEINARKCPIVHAVTKVGDVILYRHSVRHMGAKNRAAEAGHGGKNRTVIDVSYLFPGTIPKDQFVFKSKFPPAAHIAIARYRKSVADRCITDGLACAPAVVATSNLGEGPPYKERLGPSTPTDGFRGTYRGKGEGKGTWVDPNGSVYTGGFVDGVRHGFGKYKYTSGASFTGTFVDGVRTGKGTYISQGGDVYDGDWLNNFQTGFATFKSGDGSMEFEGEFDQNQPAQGKWWTRDGEVKEGMFERGNGKLYGACRITRANGVVYEGHCDHGMPHGNGVMRHPDGTVSFEGSWVRGKPQKPQGKPATLKKKTPAGQKAADWTPIETDDRRSQKAADWTPIETDDHRTYYVHAVTGEERWDMPAALSGKKWRRKRRRKRRRRRRRRRVKKPRPGRKEATKEKKNRKQKKVWRGMDAQSGNKHQSSGEL